MNKQLLAFNVMSAVKTSYITERICDSEFAKKLSVTLEADISTARVRQARAVLGIPNNTAMSHAHVEARTFLRIALNDPMRLVSDTDFRDKISEFLGSIE